MAVEEQARAVLPELQEQEVLPALPLPAPEALQEQQWAEAALYLPSP